jgi:predicted metal-dependent phosphoesterase TrpH
MRARVEPLLAELHAHTTWSDGVMTPRELIDLYGRQGFDVLCVTDHVVRTDDPWCDRGGTAFGVAEREYPRFAAELAAEADRALALYGLVVVVPGLELTYNDLDPAAAAHAVAVGLRTFVSVDDGIAGALEKATAAGAALIAAHPYDGEPAPSASRLRQRFAQDRGLAELVHRFELFNRSQPFSWVAQAGHPAVAAGDTHLPEHLYGWKTLIPCARNERAIVDYLRSRRPVYLTHLERGRRLIAA